MKLKELKIGTILVLGLGIILIFWCHNLVDISDQAALERAMQAE